MSGLPAIKAFNTGRQYSIHGQRIAWTLLSSGNIAMVDIDRGIDYVLERRHKELPVTNSTVLALYDANKTVYAQPDYSEMRELEQKLRDAAEGV